MHARPSPRAIENALASRTLRSFDADPSRLEDEDEDSREEEEEELVGRDEYEGIDSGIDEEEQEEMEEMEEEEEEDDEGGACQLVTRREVRVTWGQVPFHVCPMVGRSVMADVKGWLDVVSTYR